MEPAIPLTWNRGMVSLAETRIIMNIYLLLHAEVYNTQTHDYKEKKMALPARTETH